jgi:hypothetical protein
MGEMSDVESGGEGGGEGRGMIAEVKPSRLTDK